MGSAVAAEPPKHPGPLSPATMERRGSPDKSLIESAGISAQAAPDPACTF
jgi:hypothetical protein